MLRVMWIAAALACHGCGGKPPPSAQPVDPAETAVILDAGGADTVPLEQDLPLLVERSLLMYQDVARAFAITGEDCKAATSRLGQLAASYRDVVTANARVLHDGRAKQLRAALDVHNEEFDRSAKAIVKSPTMSKCGQDPAFTKAFDKLLEAPP